MSKTKTVLIAVTVGGALLATAVASGAMAFGGKGRQGCHHGPMGGGGKYMKRHGGGGMGMMPAKRYMRLLTGPKNFRPGRCQWRWYRNPWRGHS